MEFIVSARRNCLRHCPLIVGSVAPHIVQVKSWISKSKRMTTMLCMHGPTLDDAGFDEISSGSEGMYQGKGQ